MIVKQCTSVQDPLTGLQNDTHRCPGVAFVVHIRAICTYELSFGAGESTRLACVGPNAQDGTRRGGTERRVWCSVVLNAAVSPDVPRPSGKCAQNTRKPVPART